MFYNILLENSSTLEKVPDYSFSFLNVLSIIEVNKLLHGLGQ